MPAITLQYDKKKRLGNGIGDYLIDLEIVHVNSSRRGGFLSLTSLGGKLEGFESSVDQK